MSHDNDGGPAFPPQVVRDADGIFQEVAVYGMQSGMSLRDYFAAKALGGLLANANQDFAPLVDGKVPMLAKEAYLLADAMLKARGPAAPSGIDAAPEASPTHE